MNSTPIFQWCRTTSVFVIYCFLLVCNGAFAQESWPISSIADSLKQDAICVIRNYEIRFKVHSLQKGTAHYEKAISILNKEGKEAAFFQVMTDHFYSLSHFSGTLYSSTGQRIKKISKSDLEYTEYSESLADDDATYYYIPTYGHYPYTIVYEWEVNYKNGYISYPLFCPIDRTKQSIERSSYTLQLPVENNYKSYAQNLTFHKDQKTLKNVKTETWSLSNPILAIPSESYSPPLQERLGLLFCKPLQFSYDELKGTQQTWQSISNWFSLLLDQRSNLSSDFVAKLHQLTDSLATPRQKVNFLYHYLGKNTRYVSIQIGLGGFQPAPASEVHRVGFGDCKGLTNYLKAMLSAINIPSYYTIINTNNKTFKHSYPNMTECNHAILTVPLAKDTCYLECTNPDFAFGYLHSDIADHDAILIDSQHGGLIHLPAYADNQHKDNVHATLTLTAEGKVEKSAIRHYYSHRCNESISDIKDYTPKKQSEFINSSLYIPQSQVTNISFILDKTKPESTLCYTLNQSLYGSIMGQRLFIPINPFRHFSIKRARNKRQAALVLTNGVSKCDTITLQLPSNYAIENLPPSKEISSPFGHLQLTTHYNEKTSCVNIITSLQLKSGHHSASEYKKWEHFVRQLKRAYEEKLVIKKEES